MSKSLVFIIPANFDAITNGWCHNKTHLVQTVVDTLERSEAFKKYQGRDHLLLSTYFKTYFFVSKQKSLAKTLQNIIWPGVLDNTRKTHCQVAVLHNGPSPRPNNQPRNHTLFFIGQADTRALYQWRVRAISQLGTVGHNNILVGTPCQGGVLPPCKDDNIIESGSKWGCCTPKIALSDYLRLMSESKWNLMIRGDNSGSGRFPEAIANGVPSLIISPGVEHYLSFQCVVPWEEFTILINSTTFMSHPTASIQSALLHYGGKWNQMKEQQDLYSRHILWAHPESLAGRNTIIDSVRKCFPNRVPTKIPWIHCPKKKDLSKFLYPSHSNF